MEPNTSFPKSQEEILEDALVKQISDLSLESRQRVLRRVGACDLQKYLGTTIKVYDWGKDETKPLAAYVFPDGSEESIDIFEALKANPLDIADPRILMAIKRWLQNTRYSQVLPKPYKTDPMAFGKIASENLKKIGDAFKVNRLSANLREEVMVALIPDIDELQIILNVVWEYLYSDEIQYLSHGENEEGKVSKTKREKSEKLQILKDALKGNRVADSQAIRLQIHPVLEEILRRYLRYSLTVQKQEREVLVKQDEGEPFSITVEAFIPYESSASWSIMLHAEGSDQQWITVDALFKKCAIHGSEELCFRERKHSSGETWQYLCLRELIMGAGYSLPPPKPSFELPEHLRKIAALAGMSLPFWGEPKQSPANPYQYSQEICYKSIPLDDLPPHITKTKLDLVTDFLNDEDEEFLSRRPNWRTFNGRFINWLFGVKKDAAKKSRQRAKDIDIERGWIIPRFFEAPPQSTRRYYPPSWLDTEALLPDVFNEYSFSSALRDLPILQNIVKD